MADEQQAIAELATPAIEQEAEVEAPEVPQDVGEPEPEQEPEQEVADELDDFEHDGKTYKVPKALKGHLMKDKDYTQGKQALADSRRALEAEQAKIEERSKATDEELDTRASLRAVNAELERFKTYDWNAYQLHRQQDPLAAEEAWNYAQHMRDQKAQLEGKIGQAQTQRTQAAQQAIAKRIEDTNAALAKEIPDWTPAMAEKAVRFALEQGVPGRVLGEIWSPAAYKLLRKAEIGDQLEKRQATPPKPAQVATPVAPLQVVAAKAPPAQRKSLTDLAKSDSRDDMDAFAASFNAKMKARGH